MDVSNKQAIQKIVCIRNYKFFARFFVGAAYLCEVLTRLFPSWFGPSKIPHTNHTSMQTLDNPLAEAASHIVKVCRSTTRVLLIFTVRILLRALFVKSLRRPFSKQQ